MIDLFSDTATLPTKAMKKAMLSAKLGDEQKKEDPTTNILQKMCADLLELDSALFLPSATMANQIAIRTLCNPGDQLAGAENSHIFVAESGGIAIHSGVMPKLISTQSGIFSESEVKNLFRSEIITPSKISCITIENTTNLGGGLAWDNKSLDSVISAAHKHKVSLHLDGSRLFNAANKLNVRPSAIAKFFDTVTICLSKGLGCPMGALIVFKKKYTDKVFNLKKLFGGGLRQSGMIAASGIYALQNHIERLVEDHANADFFSHHLIHEIPAITVETDSRSTNMVFFSWNGKNKTPSQFYGFCLKNGVRFAHIQQNRFRAVFHLGISQRDIKKALRIIFMSQY